MRGLTWGFSKFWLAWGFCRHHAELRIRVFSRLWQPAPFSSASPPNSVLSVRCRSDCRSQCRLNEGVENAPAARLSGVPRSSHVDPVTGETARTFHTVGAKTKKGAEKARDALIFRLESDGGAVGSSMTVREFMEQFLRYKEASGTIEPSTVRSYRGELPWARERLDDARHLRRRGPTRSYSCLLFPQGKSSAPPQPARSPRAMTEPLSTLPCGGHSTGRDRFYWCHASRGPPCRRAI